MQRRSAGTDGNDVLRAEVGRELLLEALGQRPLADPPRAHHVENGLLLGLVEARPTEDNRPGRRPGHQALTGSSAAAGRWSAGRSCPPVQMRSSRTPPERSRYTGPSGVQANVPAGPSISIGVTRLSVSR